jgi:hypothetical protein
VKRVHSAGGAPTPPANGAGAVFKPLRISQQLLAETFHRLRECGREGRECQVLWTVSWSKPDVIERVVHPPHASDSYGFQLEGEWLNDFWLALAKSKEGVRVQIHTHPELAFHSLTDDTWPIVHTPGFLSLVIPWFATGTVGFDGAYLCGIDLDGHWQQLEIPTWIRVEDESW